MTWLSINPNSEPYGRVSAAAALAKDPSDPDAIISTLKGLVDPVAIAENYNNAEALGLDLNSIAKVRPTSNWEDDL